MKIVDAVNQMSRRNYQVVHFVLKKLTFAFGKFERFVEIIVHIHKLSCLADGQKIIARERNSAACNFDSIFQRVNIFDDNGKFFIYAGCVKMVKQNPSVAAYCIGVQNSVTADIFGTVRKNKCAARIVYVDGKLMHRCRVKIFSF